MSAFDHYLHELILRAGREARADGSAAIEAHHLLLAIAAGDEPLLTAAGLDHQGLRSALDREFTESLAAAGVTSMPSRPRSPAEGTPSLGGSAKAALDRGFATVARKRDARPADVLRGILLAPVGTVPRALALAGVDRAALIESLR